MYSTTSVTNPISAVNYHSWPISSCSLNLVPEQQTLNIVDAWSWCVSGLKWTRSASMVDFDRTTPSIPEFQHTEIKEVDSVVGQMVLLPCTVTNLGDRVVSDRLLSKMLIEMLYIHLEIVFLLKNNILLLLYYISTLCLSLIILILGNYIYTNIFA